MYRKLIVAVQIFLLPACTVNNIHLNLTETTADNRPQFFSQENSPQAILKDKTIARTVTAPQVRVVPAVCRRVPFPDLKPVPEPPIKEIEAIDPKDRKKIYEVMLAYTEQLSRANKDARLKYHDAKMKYTKQCLQ